MGLVGKSRAERTWPRPASTRHAWARARDVHPQQPPDPCVIVCWRKGTKLHLLVLAPLLEL